jgi:hypothetical protein
MNQKEPATELEKITALVERYEKKIRTSYAGSLHRRIEHLLDQFERKTGRALNGAMNFRDKSLLHLRALAMCLEMTGNAATHGEKNARLRGALEIIEATIEKLEREEFKIDDFFTWHGTENGFIFRSSYPVRELLDKIQQLETELELVKMTQDKEERHDG